MAIWMGVGMAGLTENSRYPTQLQGTICGFVAALIQWVGDQTIGFPADRIVPAGRQTQAHWHHVSFVRTVCRLGYDQRAPT